MALREVLEQVRSDISAGHANGANEQEAKDWFITPILQALGWRGPGRVRLEHPAGRERVKMDFALQGPDRRIVAFVEAKVPGADLASHVGQVMTYAFHEGVDLCVLTTGVEWWLYLPREKGDPSARRFAELDVASDSLDLLAERLHSCLGYEEVIGGSAGARALLLLEERRNQERLLHELPRAWRRLLDEPNEALVEILRSAIHDAIGQTPTTDQVKEFLRARTAGQMPTSSASQNPRAGGRGRTATQSNQESLTRPQRSTGRTERRKQRPTRVTGFTLWGEHHHAVHQYDVLNGVAEAVWRRQGDNFSRVTAISSYFSEGPYERHSKPMQIGTSNYFHEGAMSFTNMEATCERLLEGFGYHADDLTIETMAG